MTGSTNRVKSVPTVMPATITIAIEKRLAAPAPLANISGMRPATMAAVVIRIGRRRRPAAISTASSLLLPCFSCCSFATSQMRMPCLVMRLMSVTNPTWA